MRYRKQRSRGEKCKFNRFVSYQLAAYIMRMLYLLENIRPEGRHVFGMNSFLSPLTYIVIYGLGTIGLVLNVMNGKMDVK